MQLAFRTKNILNLRQIGQRNTTVFKTTPFVRSNLARGYAKRASSEIENLPALAKEERRVKSLVKPSSSSVLNTTKDNLIQAVEVNANQLEQTISSSEEALRTNTYLQSFEFVSEDDEYAIYKKSVENTNVSVRFHKNMIPDESEPNQEEVEGVDEDTPEPEATTSALVDISIDFGKQGGKQWLLSCKCGEQETLDVLTMCLTTDGWKGLPDLEAELPDNAILFMGLEEQTQENISEYLNRLGINYETSAAARWISFQKEAKKDHDFLKDLSDMLNASI